jgi:hypothetical protein
MKQIYFFICILFNDAASRPDYTASVKQDLPSKAVSHSPSLEIHLLLQTNE